MELHLEVVLLSTIKRKKPWPRFCWLGLEKESVFLLDDNRISEINMVSGRTKKKIPKLQPLLQRALATAASKNGMWLAGLLVSGEVFLWSKDRGCLKMINTATSVSQLVTAAYEGGVRLSLLVSGEGRRLLLTAVTGQVFLWECSDRQDLAGVRDGVVKGLWQQILPSETTTLPSLQNKEASQNSVFVQGEVLGDCCLTAFVFTVGAQLKVTFLKIQWEERLKLSSLGFSVRWVTQTYPLTELSPPCGPVKSRGALVPAFSPDGQLLAVALNQRDPRATQVLFISTQNFVTVSSWLGGCGSKNLSIPSKYVRSYWVACVSWAPGGLYLACVLKRGSLLLLARLGGLVSLSTSGCSVELGPAHFLPLHPLVTCSLPLPSLPRDVSPTSSCASSQDALRQRYSLTWHPRLPYLIMSDGYTASVLRAPLQAGPAALVGALLLRCADGLERAHRGLALAKPQARLVLESLPTLKLTARLQDLRKQESTSSTLPLFLRDESDSTDISQLHAASQGAGEEDSDEEGGQFPSTRVGDRGRLEFASMFDTLHAHPDAQLRDLSDPEESQGSEGGAPPVLAELEGVQRSLLTAWALTVSLGGGVSEDRGRLLRSGVRCAVRLARLLQVAPRGEKPRTARGGLSRVWPLLRNLYSLLPWDALPGGARSCLGAAVELTRRVTELILSPHSGSAKLGHPGLFSETLSSALLFLRMASRSLDLAYSLPRGASPCASHVFSVPFLKEGNESGASQNALLPRQRPSSRLLEVWRGLYRRTLQYQVDSASQMSPALRCAEQGRMAGLLCQIQRALQEHGEQLGDDPPLHRVAGEEHFLSGSYADSARVWRAELCAEKERGGTMLFVLETRFCLALLFGHLSQYRLHQALGLCEGLAHLLAPRCRLEEEGGAQPAEDVETVSEAWLPAGVGQEAACAVVRSFGRFLAAYFTNRPLAVLPPHCVGVLPPLHLPAGAAPGQRLVPVSRSRVLGEVWRQQLSEVWTVDYALELLLLGGLLPEGAWLAHSLGDWKTAASLGLAYTTYCQEQADFTRLKWRELCLPAHLQPRSIFVDQLQHLLDLEAGNELDQSGPDGKSYERFADSAMEEGSELRASVQEVLRAAVMARVDVLSQPLRRLTDTAKDLASRLSGLVPPGVYLPAPPLYCPQPASDTPVLVGDVGVLSERRFRQCVSGVLQRVLLLLRSANCSLPAAQWYITHLQLRQQLLHKKLSQPLNPFPEGLKEFVTSGAFFSHGTSGEGHLDSVTLQVIACFREVCGLCWMLHVRDQLSVSCRKYQVARTQVALSQDCDTVNHTSDSDVVQRCLDALRWACRLLPFSRFLKAEEVLQDLVLSLVSELPPITMVADILAQVFPEEEESVQVSLREKYNALLQRLRHCTVPEPSGAEPERQAMVTVLIQQQLDCRRQLQRQIAKHLAPLKRQIWERIEEEEEEAIDRFSPSRSTLSDCGCSPQSNGNSAATPTDEQETPAYGLKQQGGQTRSDGGRSGERGSGRSGAKEAASSLPPVGSWEFELFDEEYPRFLELFLSYVLERDCSEDKDSALPLLSGFAPQLREAELHSLAFDVLTTLKRRQRGAQRSATGTRQGGAHAPAPQTPSSGPRPPVQSEALVRSGLACGPLAPGPRAGKPRGLFGLRQAQQPTRVSQAEGVWTGSEDSQSPTVSAPQSDYKALPAPPALDLPEPEPRFQDLSRLLEWMIRWADRRVRVSQKKNDAPAAEGVVMRARASTPAVLTALRVLERKYTAALLATDEHCTYFRVPEAEFTAALMQPEEERTAHTRCTLASESAISLPPLDGEVSEESELEEVEPEADMGEAGYQYGQEGALCSDPDSRPRQADEDSEDETSSCPEGDGRSEALCTVGSASCISVQIKTLPRGPERSHDRTLTLADLDSDGEETEGDVSHPASVDVLDPDTALEQNVLGLHPGPQVQSFPSSGTSQPRRGPDTVPPPAPPDPFRQLVQDQMFRLVQFQQMSFISLLQTVAASFPNQPQLNHTQCPLPTDTLLPSNQTPYPLSTAHVPPSNQTQYPIPTANLPPLNQTQYPIPTANPPPLNQAQYPIPTANPPPLNQAQYPIPTANLPPLNQNQYPLPTDTLPPFNQSQYPLPTANPPPLNQTQYPIPTANLPPLIQNHYPLPTANPSPLNQTQYPIPTANAPPLIQTQYLLPTANMSHQLGAPFSRPRQQGPHEFGAQNLGLDEQDYIHADRSRGPDEQAYIHTDRSRGPVTVPEAPASEPEDPIPSLSLSSESPCQSDMESLSEEEQGFPVSPEQLRRAPAEREDLSLCSSRSSCIAPVGQQGVALLCGAGSSQGGSSAMPPARGGIQLLRLPPSPPPVTLREAWPKPFSFPQERRAHTAGAPASRPEVPAAAGKGRGLGAPLQLILAPRSQGQALPRGLPLLRFHPEPRLPAAACPAPFAGSAPPLIAAPGPPGPPGLPAHPAFSPSVQLLHRDPDPGNKVLLGRAGWGPERGETAGGRPLLRLLTGVPRAWPADATLASSKRQKRRDEKEQNGQNENVSGQDGFHLSPTEADRAEASGPALEEDSGLSREWISSALAGQDVVSRALSTAAELHAYASTHKRPPVVHDVSTNTDSAGDVPVGPAAAVCPGVLLNLQFPREPASPDRDQPELDVPGSGRHFINVIDLEDEELLEHLPPRPTSASPTPVFTQPHLAGASVPSPTSPDRPNTDHMTVETMLVAQLEPRERPGPPAAPGLPAAPDALQGEEPFGLLPVRESVSLEDSLGLGVALRDVAPHSDSSRVGVGVEESVEVFETTMERSIKLADEPLDLSDTLAELVRGASASLLGLSDSQTDRWTSRLGEQKEVRVEEEREELLAWMRRKQKERIVEYRRQREERREKEHMPFTPSSTQTLTSRDLSTSKKLKERKEKTLLRDHHTLRAQEACSLITELLKPSPVLPTLTKAPQAQSANHSIRRSKAPQAQSAYPSSHRSRASLSQSAYPSSHRSRASLSQSANQSIRRSKAHLSQSTHQSSHSRAAQRGWTGPEGRRGRSAPLLHTSGSPRRTAGTRSTAAVGQHRPSDRHLHRPGALPDARLTRRGVRDVRGRRVGKGWMNRTSPSLREDKGRAEEEEEAEESDEERAVSPWDPPLEIRRLLGLEEEGSVMEGNESSGGGARLWLEGADWDPPSESTGSILSKLDWTAIEKMVAGEEDV